MSEALPNQCSSLGESRKVSLGGKEFLVFVVCVCLLGASWGTKVAYGPGQPYRHSTAGQLAPRAKVVRYFKPGLSPVQTTGSQSVRQQPERAPPQKQPHFRIAFPLRVWYMCVFQSMVMEFPAT